jgi:hypothetical protein
MSHGSDPIRSVSPKKRRTIHRVPRTHYYPTALCPTPNLFGAAFIASSLVCIRSRTWAVSATWDLFGCQQDFWSLKVTCYRKAFSWMYNISNLFWGTSCHWHFSVRVLYNPNDLWVWEICCGLASAADFN